MLTTGSIAIYKPLDKDVSITVTLQDDTVWLSQAQLTVLFNTTKQNISRHLNNIFNEGELTEKSVVKEYLTTAADGKKYRTKHYNLDLIISLGYRVKSREGTHFRIWASKILKEFLVNGYVINEKKLKDENKRLKELQRTINLIDEVIGKQHTLRDKHAYAILNLITEYSYALQILDQYDRNNLSIVDITYPSKEVVVTPNQARKAVKKYISTLSSEGKSLGVVGIEKDSSFDSSIQSIYQTFNGAELYPSIEEKAANLLYFVTKNHSFIDGNKRIAAFLFVWFLSLNGVLHTKDGDKRLADNAIVALTLLTAESKTSDKAVIIKLIVNLINKNNYNET